MNIFVLDRDPTKAATMLCDKHVVKMIVETAQMLCTTAHVNGHTNAPYKATHKNHPCTLWSNESSENWDWLIEHGEAMCVEYTHRYGRTHKTQTVIDWCKKSNVGPQKNVGLTPFKQAMPDMYKNPDPVKAYRDYYRCEKSRFAKWRNKPPTWW